MCKCCNLKNKNNKNPKTRLHDAQTHLPFLTHGAVSDLFTQIKLNSPRVHAQIPRRIRSKYISARPTTPPRCAFSRTTASVVSNSANVWICRFNVLTQTVSQRKTSIFVVCFLVVQTGIPAEDGNKILRCE